MNFQKAFENYVAANKKTWAHDRKLTMGASEAFQCIRRTYYTKSGASPDPDYVESFGATKRGDILEKHYVVPALLSQTPPGSELLWAGDDQVTLIKERLSATPDGILVDAPRDALKDYGIDDIESDSFLIEIKSFDSRLDLKEPKPVHVGQAQQQLGLTHETTNHRPEYAVILYVNASWLDDIRPFVVKRDPKIYEAAKKRADKVFNAVDAKELPPEGKLGGGSECQYCPFVRQCQRTQTGQVPTEKHSKFSEKSEAELADHVAAYTKAQAMEEGAKEAKAAASESIKEWLRNQNTRYAKTSTGVSVSYSKSSGRKSYDMEKLVEDTGVNLDDYVSVGEDIERLTVRVGK